MNTVVEKLKCSITGDYANFKSVVVAKEAANFILVTFSEVTTLNGYNANNELVFTNTSLSPSITADYNVVSVEITDKNNLVGIDGSFGGIYPDMKLLFGCAALKTLKGGKYSQGDIYNLRYCTELETFMFDTFSQPSQEVTLYGDISVFKNMPNLKTIQCIGNDKIIGDIGSLNSCANLETLTLQGSGSVRGGLEGSINDLSALTKLGTLTLINNVHIGGSITELAERQKGARSQSTLAIIGNGTILVNPTTVAVNGSLYTISFDGNGGYTIS